MCSAATVYPLFNESVMTIKPVYRHGGVQRKYGGKKFSKDMALLFAFFKSIPRHRAIKLNNRPINTLSLFVIQGDAASDLRSDFFQSHCHF